MLAVGLPILAGLLWNQASDNPIWPLVRNSSQSLRLRNAQLSPVSPDGLYRARVVRATYLGRFSETLVFLTVATDPWPPRAFDSNHAILEVAGLRSLDAIDWLDFRQRNPYPATLVLTARSAKSDSPPPAPLA